MRTLTFQPATDQEIFQALTRDDRAGAQSGTYTYTTADRIRSSRNMPPLTAYENRQWNRHVYRRLFEMEAAGKVRRVEKFSSASYVWWEKI